jgi:hypothetical protein
LLRITSPPARNSPAHHEQARRQQRQEQQQRDDRAAHDAPQHGEQAEQREAGERRRDARQHPDRRAEQRHRRSYQVGPQGAVLRGEVDERRAPVEHRVRFVERELDVLEDHHVGVRDRAVPVERRRQREGGREHREQRGGNPAHARLARPAGEAGTQLVAARGPRERAGDQQRDEEGGDREIDYVRVVYLRGGEVERAEDEGALRHDARDPERDREHLRPPHERVDRRRGKLWPALHRRDRRCDQQDRCGEREQEAR